MSAVLTEQLGPRGRRRVQIANWVSLTALVALAAFIVYRFWVTGNLEPRLYEQFVDFETGWPRFLAVGLLNTLRAAAIAMLIATFVGFVMALGRISRNVALRWAARIYIEVFRAIPVLLFILFAFLGLQTLGLRFITPFWGLVTGLAAYNSAVLAEIFRAGILSLDRGQSEAASAIGLTYWQSMRLVILPQAIRRMTPAIVAQLATLTKDTSLGFVVGYQELIGRSEALAQASPSNQLQSFLVVAVVYFIVIYLLSRLARRLEVQQRKRLGARKVEAGAGLEDIEALGEEADEDEMAGGRPAPATSG